MAKKTKNRFKQDEEFKHRDDIKVSECTNGTFQVRNKNIKNIDDSKNSWKFLA